MLGAGGRVVRDAERVVEVRGLDVVGVEPVARLGDGGDAAAGLAGGGGGATVVVGPDMFSGG